MHVQQESGPIGGVQLNTVETRSFSALGGFAVDLQGAESFQRVWDSQFLMRATPALGLPILAVSTGLVGQSPVGVQIVAGRFREDLCLRAGQAIEARGTPPAPIDPIN